MDHSHNEDRISRDENVWKPKILGICKLFLVGVKSSFGWIFQSVDSHRDTGQKLRVLQKVVLSLTLSMYVNVPRSFWTMVILSTVKANCPSLVILGGSWNGTWIPSCWLCPSFSWDEEKQTKNKNKQSVLEITHGIHSNCHGAMCFGWNALCKVQIKIKIFLH